MTSKRLTYKVNDYYYFDNVDELMDVSNKLGQYEDIDEELGIDLITLFKVIKNGFYTNFYTKNRYCAPCYNIVKLELKRIQVNDYDECFSVNFKDYGKTWALTREELE